MASDERIGQVVGPYLLEARLGSGGMASVYRGVHRYMRVSRAVKVMSPTLAADDRFVRLFHREAELAASLRHPHIVQIYDVAHDGAAHYLVMELLEGRSLRDILREEARLAVGRALRLLRQLASALDYAHASGVAHHDIKPGNIFVGPNDHLTIVDLGIARAADHTRLTVTLGAGTPEYMAPELFDEELIDPGMDERAQEIAVDLYALGVVAYELVTGALPFRGRSRQAVIFSQVHRSPVAVRVHVPEVPADVEAAIHRQLSKHAAERFPSAGQFVDALIAAYSATDVEFVSTLDDAALLPPAPSPSDASATGATGLIEAGATGPADQGDLLVVTARLEQQTDRSGRPGTSAQANASGDAPMDASGKSAQPLLETGDGPDGSSLGAVASKQSVWSPAGVPPERPPIDGRSSGTQPPRSSWKRTRVGLVAGATLLAIVTLAGRLLLTPAETPTRETDAASTPGTSASASVGSATEQTPAVSHGASTASLSTPSATSALQQALSPQAPGPPILTLTVTSPLVTATVSPADQLRAGQAAAVAGDFERALTHLGPLKREHPDLPDLDNALIRSYLGLAAILRERGEFARGRTLIDEALRLRPDDAAALAARQETELAERWATVEANWNSDRERAMAALDEIIRLQPNHQEARQKLYALLIATADELIAGGDSDGAYLVLMRAQEVLPSAGEAAQRLAAYTPTPQPVVRQPTPTPDAPQRTVAPPAAAPKPAAPAPAPQPTPTKAPFIPASR